MNINRNTKSTTDIKILFPEKCIICNTPVVEKLQQRCLDFFGHIHKGIGTCIKKPHLICNDCNLELIQRINSNANPNRVLTQCILCNSVPLENDWRKKFSWDAESLEFRIESAPIEIPIEEIIVHLNPSPPQNDYWTMRIALAMYYAGIPLGALIGHLINPNSEGAAALGGIIGFMAAPLGLVVAGEVRGQSYWQDPTIPRVLVR